MKGLKKINEKISELQELSQPRKVGFDELFNENFMRNYTQFSSIDELLEVCNITTNEELEEKIDTLNDYVSKNSDFSDFNEMYQTAGHKYAEQILNNILR